MVHKAAVFRLFSFALVCPFAIVKATTTEIQNSLSSPQDLLVAREVLQPNEESSRPSIKRESLTDVLLHEIREELPSVQEVESFIESTIARPVEKREPRRKTNSNGNNNNNNNNSNSTQDDDQSGADRSAATIHISFAISAVVLAGFLQI
ncbi:hypothetical protein F4810DRAFT_684241 [Camillea tinctor]|nr:hypothetical protein F4810DRAFT_684241 [Camillea tinctor]